MTRHEALDLVRERSGARYERVYWPAAITVAVANNCDESLLEAIGVLIGTGDEPKTLDEAA